MTHQHPGPAVIRTIPIPVCAFNHVKDTQRKHEAETGKHMSLNEAFAFLILDHQRITEKHESRSYDNANRIPAILR
jgi:hypothetical protein